LNSLTTHAKKHNCQLGNILLTLDAEAKQSLFAVMASRASATDISKVLRAEGFIFPRRLVSEKRLCMAENNECKCRDIK